MFSLIAKTILAPRAANVCAAEEPAPAMRAEVESLFRAEMDSFTRIAMDRRARKAAMPVALAA
jgi:hypothetical protein